MKRTYYLLALLLLTLVIGCGQQSGQTTHSDNGSENDTVDWSKEARLKYKELAYYYNNNIHDTLVMMVPEVLESLSLGAA